ncbi:MAG: hypothetical protein JEZ08_18985 [Clostridiales bacterium]|nr:hypothetical protein [Clostridiales bacterium]
MIIFIRGKAATGKTFLANEINLKFNMATTSKDRYFDELLLEGMAWPDANEVAYNRLVDEIHQHIKSEEDLLVDIGLAHTPYYLQFISKLKYDASQVKSFLCICSDQEEWESRINKRIQNPENPNQLFKSIEEATDHYEKYEISLIEGETLLDSCDIKEELIEIISKKCHLV